MNKRNTGGDRPQPPGWNHSQDISAVASLTRTGSHQPVRVETATMPGAASASEPIKSVANAAVILANRKGGTARIRLNPPELGSVRIRIEVVQGMVRGQIETETETARDLFKHHMGDLGRSMEQRGLHLQDLQVRADTDSSANGSGRHAATFNDAAGRSFQGRETDSWQSPTGDSSEPSAPIPETESTTPELGSRYDCFA